MKLDNVVNMNRNAPEIRFFEPEKLLNFCVLKLFLSARAAIYQIFPFKPLYQCFSEFITSFKTKKLLFFSSKSKTDVSFLHVCIEKHTRGAVKKCLFHYLTLLIRLRDEKQTPSLCCTPTERSAVFNAASFQYFHPAAEDKRSFLSHFHAK
ncbi:hypothetical protein ILYODFUR_011383 [Ilyodon furcidens]|uniref:Uncharacterized protein n=1 Tax=Ilyodon furcidens TaxID=33524 RepID=A0ABV0TU12_9TELE